MTTQYRKISTRDPYTGEVWTVSTAHAAAVCGVSLRTAQRWAAAGSAPEPAQRLLAIMVHGVPPCRDWWRFRFRRGELVNLENADTLGPGEIRGAAMAWAEAAALRRRLRLLEEDASRVIRPIKKPGRVAGSG